MNASEQKLKVKYEYLYENGKPDTDKWVQAPPAIPFVGDYYGQPGRCKVLVYGSAENLNFERTVELRFNRNREGFNQWSAGTTGNLFKSVGNWFPWVHMTPISDGTLLTVARYLMHAFDKIGFAEEPEAFLHQIAVGNYGKFSQKGRRNSDYASTPKLLKDSDAYVQADMDVLKPEVVILPKTIHLSRFEALRREHNGHVPKEVWRIYQTNARATIHAKRAIARAGHGPTQLWTEWMGEWLGNISRSKQSFVKHQLDWIDMKAAQERTGERSAWPVRYPMT